MNVRVLPFGVLKDWLGAAPALVELPAGSTVADLLTFLGRQGRGRAEMLRGIAVAVNAEFANPVQVLRDGDEVGLLPPVSGGAQSAESCMDEDRAAIVSLTRERIDAEGLAAAAKSGADGAVVVFDGIVRNNTRGRQTLYLDYEAYEEMALKLMGELASEARSRFSVRSVTMVHRLGRLEVGDTSVLIVVASAHRAQAFEACRWLIDTLKKKVPIWKKETFVDGAVWAAGEPFPEGVGVDDGEAGDGR
jgi:molybdopterin synthase catalytic subunit